MRIDLVAVISSVANPKIKLVRNLQARRSVRQAERLFVVEGVRLVEEAARATDPPRLVLYADNLDARGRAALDQLRGRGAAAEAVTTQVMASASGTETPPGLLAVAPMPALPPPSLLSLALVLDGLRDPGNLGAILRTADAAGLEAVFLAPGTVDLYNPKVVRAAMGAHFHLPILTASWDVLVERLAGLTVWLAEAGDGVTYQEVDWRRPSALIVGSEAVGPGQAARRLAPRRVSIPMPGQAESLNAAVAAAVLMFEAVRQRSRSSKV